MDTLQLYACILGGVFALLFLVHAMKTTYRVNDMFETFLAQHLTYPLVFSHQSLIGPWTRAALVLKVLYVAANLFFLLYRSSTIESVGQKAGVMASINMTPLYLSFHHGAMAGYLGISLSMYRSIHHDTALVTVSLSAFHMTVMLLKGPAFAWENSQHLHGFLVSQSLIL